MIKRERRLNGAWSRASRSRFTDFCFYFLDKNAVNHTAHEVFLFLLENKQTACRWLKGKKTWMKNAIDVCTNYEVEKCFLYFLYKVNAHFYFILHLYISSQAKNNKFLSSWKKLEKTAFRMGYYKWIY